MSTEQNKALVRRYLEAFNRHSADAQDGVLAPTYTFHEHGETREDTSDASEFIRDFWTAIPDLHYEDDYTMVAEGDLVSLQATLTGTFTAPMEFFGRVIQPNGLAQSYWVWSVFRFEDELVVEWWFNPNPLGLKKWFFVDAK